VKRFVVLPHADFTLSWEAPEGFEVLDLARAFVERLQRPDTLEQEISQARASVDGARRLLALEVGKSLLSRAHGERTHLRAIAALLAGICAPGSGVMLRLDDLELEQGTTESSADAIHASQSALPFAPELEAAVAQVGAADTIRLWFERDQQLPALFAVHARLPETVAVELAGPFAWMHREALARHLPQVRFVDDASAARITGAPGFAGPGWRWGAADPHGWAGTVEVDLLAAPEVRPPEGLKVALVPFCGFGDEVVSVLGNRFGRSEVERGLARFAEAGVRVVGEWWVGAPGVGEAELDATAAALVSAPLASLVGVRPFHWTRGRKAPPFGALPVGLLPVAAERDLWRSHPFRAEGTLSAEALQRALESLPVRLLASGRELAPGRLAQACVAPIAPGGKGRVAVDPDCSLVQLPFTLDGKPSPTHYAVNLRNGVTMAVDPRLVPSVKALETPTPAAQALSALGGSREKVLSALLAKGVLAEVA
jgi:hypothetical protein